MVSDEGATVEQQDPLFTVEAIPTLYSKIGLLTVRVEMLMEENRQLRELLQQPVASD